MFADDPYALFITWTTYGTWLPGDERGHVSDRVRPYQEWQPKQNQLGAEYAPGDEYTQHLASERQCWPTVRLTPPQAVEFARALVEPASERKWSILRAAIMANHAHVLITHCPADGPMVRRALKGVSQAALSRQHGSARRWWTKRGSNRLRRGERAIEDTTRYIADQPGMLVEIIEMEVIPRDP